MTIFEYPELKRKYALLEDVVRLKDVEIKAKDNYLDQLLLNFDDEMSGLALEFNNKLSLAHDELNECGAHLKNQQYRHVQAAEGWNAERESLLEEIRGLKDTVVRMATSSAPATSRPTGNQVMGMLNEMLGGIDG